MSERNAQSGATCLVKDDASLVECLFISDVLQNHFAKGYVIPV